jgi:hypothetical protein
VKHELEWEFLTCQMIAVILNLKDPEKQTENLQNYELYALHSE